MSIKYQNIKNKVVLLRLDLNVPINNGKVQDDYRIVSSLPTIEILLKKSKKTQNNHE